MGWGRGWGRRQILRLTLLLLSLRFVPVLPLSQSFSHVQVSAAPWTIIAHEAPLSMGFPSQEYWSMLSCSSPGDLPNPGTEPTSLVSPALQADSLPLAPPGKPASSV